LGYSGISSTIAALLSKAETGSVQHARELREWLKLAGLDGGDLPADMVRPEDLTPEQRAVAKGTPQRGAGGGRPCT
jgi:hypothetical protein